MTSDADQSEDLPSDNDIYSSSDFSEKPNLGEDALDFTKLQKLKPPFLFNPREYIRQTLFCCTSSKCYRVARMERAFEKARGQLEEEFDIVQILRD